MNAIEKNQAVTADSVDPKFNEPYVAVNEWRETPVPHHYVHGGFKGTDAKFSLYFPPKEQYEGRFFHNTYPMATTSDIGPFPIQFDVAVGDLGFTFDSGAYYLQTNLGGADRAPPADSAVAAYRVNAAAAKYSRIVATEFYGTHRPFGYLFGGSGGSYQVMGSAENTTGVWDGFVPYVLGTPNAVPSMFTVRMHALRVLRQRNKFPAIMDAVNPGGSGDPYAGLNEEEATALKEATLLGYPLRGWWNHDTLDSGYFYNVAGIVPLLDPSYLEDFWSKPGYLGTDPKSSIGAARFTFETEITEAIEGFPRSVVLAAVPDRDCADAHIVILSGAAAGKSIAIARIKDNTLGFAFGADHKALAKLQPGDRVRIDNSWVLAQQTYQRHQMPTPDMYGWDQYRAADGTPLYPQRGILTGRSGAANTAGAVPDGHIKAKTLVLEVLMDIDALPWQADWYRSRIKASLGENFEDNFAIWFIDHAQHDNPQSKLANAYSVSFAGALQQALRDLSAWVEKGIRPADTKYKIVDTQVELPANAVARGGIQPVVALQANGGERAEISKGDTVSFSAQVEVPPGAGKIVAAEWDFAGTGDYPDAAQIAQPDEKLHLTATHAFNEPGTYFPVLRVTSQREGDPATQYGRVQNLGRVRIVVK